MGERILEGARDFTSERSWPGVPARRLRRIRNAQSTGRIEQPVNVILFEGDGELVGILDAKVDAIRVS